MTFISIFVAGKKKIKQLFLLVMVKYIILNIDNQSANFPKNKKLNRNSFCLIDVFEMIDIGNWNIDLVALDGHISAWLFEDHHLIVI